MATGMFRHLDAPRYQEKSHGNSNVGRCLAHEPVKPQAEKITGHGKEEHHRQGAKAEECHVTDAA